LNKFNKSKLGQCLLEYFIIIFVVFGPPIISIYLIPFFPSLISNYSYLVFLLISSLIFAFGLYSGISYFSEKLKSIQKDHANNIKKFPLFFLSFLELLFVVTSSFFLAFISYFLSTYLVSTSAEMAEPFDRNKWNSSSQKRFKMVQSLLKNVILVGMNRKEVEDLIGPPLPQKTLTLLSSDCDVMYSLGDYDLSLVPDPAYLLI